LYKYKVYWYRWLLVVLMISEIQAIEEKKLTGVNSATSALPVIISYLLENEKLSGLEKIIAYANGDLSATPSLEDYELAGVSGVTSENIEEVNKRLLQITGVEVNTIEKLQIFVDQALYSITEEKIVRYAKRIQDIEPTLEDYQTIGMRCVNTQNVEVINQALRDETYYDVRDAYFIQQVVYDANNMKNIILDNDAFDPDWVIMMAATMGLDNACEIHTLGVVTTGTDLNRRQGLSYSAIMHYYGRGDIPLGLNGRQSMRSYYLDATSYNPKHIDYRGPYVSIDQFESDGCLDYEECYGRNESTGMLCALLSNVKRKVTWVIGGHMHNIANLLRETQLCNGKQLVSEKIDKIVITSGWTSRTSGEVEMNFSEGTTSPNSATDATKYLFANRPENVEIVITAIPNSGTGDPRVGDIFRRDEFQNSPMAFILSVPRYGVYGDHGLSDTDALMYAVRDVYTKDGFQYTQKINTCFHVNRYGAVTIGNPCGKQDYYLEKTTSDYARYLEAEVVPLLENGFQKTLNPEDQ